MSKPLIRLAGQLKLKKKNNNDNQPQLSQEELLDEFCDRLAGILLEQAIEMVKKENAIKKNNKNRKERI